MRVAAGRCVWQTGNVWNILNCGALGFPWVLPCVVMSMATFPLLTLPPCLPTLPTCPPSPALPHLPSPHASAELHGDMTQAARLESLERFRKNEAAFLLATDVAARGLDISGVQVGAGSALHVHLQKDMILLLSCHACSASCACRAPARPALLPACW